MTSNLPHVLQSVPSTNLFSYVNNYVLKPRINESTNGLLSYAGGKIGKKICSSAVRGAVREPCPPDFT